MNRFILLLVGFCLPVAVFLATEQAAAQDAGRAGYARPRVGGPSDLRRGTNPLLEGPLYTPYDTVRFARADAAALYAVQVQYDAQFKAGIVQTPFVGLDVSHMRYLSLYNIPRSRRAALTESVAIVLNSLSRSPIVRNAVSLVVPDTDGTLLRVYLKDFRLTPKSWDLLAELGSGPLDRRTPEPYFHAVITQKFDGEEEQDVKTTKMVKRYDSARGGYVTEEQEVVEKKKVKVKKTKKTLAAAPWLALERDPVKEGLPGSTIASLVDLTQTANPILRADWFFTFAFVAPRYYDFFELGVDGNRLEADFKKLVFADDKTSARAGVDAKGVVVNSKVALASRSMIRYPTVNHALGGFYWETYDSKKSTGKNNPMQNLLRGEFDAKEIIASLPNGFQVYAVADNKGKLLDLADAAIAQDFQTQLQDKQVYTGRSCASCHDQGMWFIRDNVRKLSQKKIALLVPDPKDALRVETLFFRYDLKTLTDRDASLFEAAVLEATKKKPIQAIGNLSRATYDYLDREITLEQVVLEVGVPKVKLLAILKKGIGVDFTLTGLLDDPPEPIRRDQWETDGFPQTQLLLLKARAWHD